MLLNGLHSFLLKRSTPATIAMLMMLTLLFFWLINVHGVPGIPPIDSLLRVGLPDMLLTYSPASIHTKFVQFGESGRLAYRMFLERVDFLFPTIYGLFFVTSTTFGFSRLFPQRPALQILPFLTLATTIFDYAENICFLALLRSFPREQSGLEKLANCFTLAKWFFAAYSILLLLVCMVGLLVLSRRRIAYH